MPRTTSTLLLALLLLSPLTGRAEEKTRWFSSLGQAKRAALTQRKPILCVLLKKGEAESRKLEREYTRSKKLAKLLDEFVCVKLDRAKHLDLVEKYGLKRSPSTVFFTMTGSPLKLVVGPFSTGKYIAQAKAALEKHRTLWKPKRPTVRPERPAPPPEKIVPRVRHTATCPTGCAPCTKAIEDSLAWLVRRQRADGSWRKPDADRVLKNEEGKDLTRSIDHIDVALTSVAGIALLAAGTTLEKGEYRRELARAVEFVGKSIRLDGIISNKTGNDYVFLVHANFETSLGAMFLAEAYRLRPEPKLRERLSRVAKYLTTVQDERTGAWGYSYDFKEYPAFEKRGWRLLATTYCCLAALNSMRDAGIPVSESVIERGAKYILACRGRDGAFVYRAEFRAQNGHPGTTAGALFALARSGAVDERTLSTLRARHRRHYREFAEFGKHWWFFLFFTALAMNEAGPGAIADFDEHFRDILLNEQKGNGTWEEPDGNGGSVFSTAIGALVLQGLDRVPVLGARPTTAQIDVVRKPKYLKPPHPSSRVKVFKHRGAYRADLVVSVDGSVDDEYLSSLRRGILGANRKLYDVTDGQMSLNRVEIATDRGRWDTADIRITKEFYDAENNPHPWAHGITRVSKRTDVVRGMEKERNRIGDWIMFPYLGRGNADVIRWDDSRFVHVLAHEICHYLFGVKDEYDTRNGRSWCDCIMGKRRATELCRDEGHTDDRQDASCWELAKGLYPRLTIPVVPDPGPWDPPLPEMVIPR